MMGYKNPNSFIYQDLRDKYEYIASSGIQILIITNDLSTKESRGASGDAYLNLLEADPIFYMFIGSGDYPNITKPDQYDLVLYNFFNYKWDIDVQEYDKDE